jgi:hypothetical protein
MDSATLLNVVGIVKGRETYFVVYPDEQFPLALGAVARWACNPELSFTPKDAGCVAMRMKELMKEGVHE